MRLPAGAFAVLAVAEVAATRVGRPLAATELYREIIGEDSGVARGKGLTRVHVHAGPAPRRADVC